MTDSALSRFALRLGAIGDRPTDTPEDQLKHRLLVYMGVLMSGGGVLWGSIALFFGLKLPAAVPYGYVVLTALNLAFFAIRKQFGPVRFVQVLISLLLPFLFQWSLGGFWASGAVMLWAMLAIVGSHAFAEARWSVAWLALYVALTVVSGAIDGAVRERFAGEQPAAVSTWFFVTNIVVISSIVFGLTIWLVSGLDRARTELTALAERLEDTVGERTRQLREAAARSNAILDNMADGLVAVAQDDTIQAVNPALSELLVLDATLMGQPASEVLPPQLAELARRSRVEGVGGKVELALPGGRTASAVASPIRTQDDGVTGSVLLVRDMTLEKEVDRMKTDFIATVSHELRTPLTSVLGFAKLTKSKLDSTILPLVPQGDKKVDRAVEQVRSNVGIILSEGERLTSLINDVLDISKMEAGRMEWRMEPLDPVELVDRGIAATSGLFPPEAGVTLEREVRGRVRGLDGDHDRLLQVIINLISNAAKFTTEGSVTVGVEEVMGGIEFWVRDTGTGIDPAQHGAIFEKFRQVGDTLTNKPKGTGLGLPICRQIVTAHDGTIGVRSAPGQGSTFWFLLPIKEMTPTRLRRRPEMFERPASVATEGIEVLVADDDPNLRELVKQQLSEKGYRVRLVGDGASAIQAVREKAPDVLVLDVMMPDISGFDVLTVLKSQPATASLPILVLTIHHDRERAIRMGVDAYLTKPADSETLLQELARILQRKRSAHV